MSNVTPEEKLLGVIKKAQGKSRLKKQLKAFTKINILLVGLIIVVLAVFLVDIFTFQYDIPEVKVDFSESGQKVRPLPMADDFDDDMDEDRDVIFKERSFISEEEVIKDLNLLGIVTGDDDQAIIEDKTVNKTLFLYKGDNIKEFIIFDIKESSVILEHEGEKIELKI